MSPLATTPERRAGRPTRPQCAEFSWTSCVAMCNGVALRGTCRSPGVTPRARSLGRYTLPPRRRVDEQHLPRIGATDAAPSLTPTAPTAFLCSHPMSRKRGFNRLGEDYFSISVTGHWERPVSRWHPVARRLAGLCASRYPFLPRSNPTVSPHPVSDFPLGTRGRT